MARLRTKSTRERAFTCVPYVHRHQFEGAPRLDPALSEPYSPSLQVHHWRNTDGVLKCFGE